MAAISIYFILVCYSLYSYIKRDFFHFLVGASLICYDGFGVLRVLTTGGFNPVYDSVIALCICSVIILIPKRGVSLLNVKGDPIAKLIIALLSYRLLVTIITIFVGNESLFGALSEYRYSLCYLLYFLFRNIDKNSIARFFNFLWRGAVFSYVGYLMWLFTFGNNAEESSIGNPFYVDALFLSFPLFFYFFFEGESTKDKKRGVISFIVLLFTLARGVLLATILTVFVYVVFIKKRIKYLIVAAVFGLFMLFAFKTLDSTKTESGSIDIKSEFEEIENLSGDYENYKRGSLALRFVMVLERIEYMTSKPINLWFGVGPLKEITAQKKLGFITGTNAEIDGETIRLQIASDDVGLLASLVRYGVFDLLIFLSLLFSIIHQFYKTKNRKYMTSGMLIVLTMFFSIPTSDMFTNPFSLFMFLLFASMIGEKREIVFYRDLPKGDGGVKNIK